MAMTIPEIGKAIEDLTGACNKTSNEVEVFKGEITEPVNKLKAEMSLKKSALAIEDFYPEGVDSLTTEQQEQAQLLLEAQAKSTNSFFNVVRNKNGSITLPEAVEDTDAVNKKTLLEEINKKIESIIDNAPEELDTLKELADILQNNKSDIGVINTALSNRYTKEESNNKFVLKESGKVLSSNDFTDEEKQKLQDIDATGSKYVDIFNFDSEIVETNKIWNGKKVYRYGINFKMTGSAVSKLLPIESSSQIVNFGGTEETNGYFKTMGGWNNNITLYKDSGTNKWVLYMTTYVANSTVNMYFEYVK